MNTCSYLPIMTGVYGQEGICNECDKHILLLSMARRVSVMSVTGIYYYCLCSKLVVVLFLLIVNKIVVF